MIENKHDNLCDADDEKLDFAELEKKLNSQLENEISGLKSLCKLPHNCKLSHN